MGSKQVKAGLRLQLLENKLAVVFCDVSKIEIVQDIREILGTPASTNALVNLAGLLEAEIVVV